MQSLGFTEMGSISMRCVPAVVWLLLTGSAVVFGESPDAHPNIIFILADDLGAHDPHCFGSTFHETPNIDALAARGVKFTQAYAASPLCSPTRSSILAGIYPARSGITTPSCHELRVNLEIFTLFVTFKSEDKLFLRRRASRWILAWFGIVSNNRDSNMKKSP